LKFKIEFENFVKFSNEIYKMNINHIVDDAIKIILKDLVYIVFGSPSSTDLDVVVWIPENLIRYQRMHKIICQRLDKILPQIVKSDKVVDKVANTCLAHWDLDLANILLWCQKGSLAESWNAYIMTQDFHIQNYNKTKINTLMPRTKEDITFNILSATRRILACLTHAVFISDPEINMKKLLSATMQLPQIKELKEERARFIANIFKIWDVQSTNFPMIGNKLTEIQKKYRREFSKIVKLLSKDETTNDDVLNQYWILYEESSKFVAGVRNTFQLNCMHNVESCQFRIESIVSAIHKMKFIGLQTSFFELIDFTNIELIDKDDPLKQQVDFDNWKTIAFQLGQKFILIRDKEVFTKEDISHYLPQLEPFLFRKPTDKEQRNQLQKLLLLYNNEIYKFVNVDMTEIDFNLN